MHARGGRGLRLIYAASVVVSGIRRRTTMGRLTTTADVGKAAALLVRIEAGFITRQTLRVDGGASLMNAEVPPELQLPAR